MKTKSSFVCLLSHMYMVAHMTSICTLIYDHFKLKKLEYDYKYLYFYVFIPVHSFYYLKVK